MLQISSSFLCCVIGLKFSSFSGGKTPNISLFLNKAVSIRKHLIRIKKDKRFFCLGFYLVYSGDWNACWYSEVILIPHIITVNAGKVMQPLLLLLNCLDLQLAFVRLNVDLLNMNVVIKNSNNKEKLRHTH